MLLSPFAIISRNISTSALPLSSKVNSMRLLNERGVLERLLAVYPTAVDVWKLYIDLEAAANRMDRAGDLFRRALLVCPDVSLYDAYVRFVSFCAGGRGAEHNANVDKAYAYSLERVGHAIDSGKLWLKYVKFLKSLPLQSRAEEIERNTKLRKVLQTAIVLPIQDVASLWSEYASFEHALNADLAEGLKQEYGTRNVSARTSLRQRLRRFNVLPRGWPTLPHVDPEKHARNVARWRDYIQWEKDNSHHLPPEQRTDRVMFAYRQAFMYQRHAPELWLDAALFLVEQGDHDEASLVLAEGAHAMPTSLLMAFMRADFEEQHRNRPAGSKDAYNTIILSSLNALCSTIASLLPVRDRVLSLGISIDDDDDGNSKKQATKSSGDDDDDEADDDSAAQSKYKKKKKGAGAGNSDGSSSSSSNNNNSAGASNGHDQQATKRVYDDGVLVFDLTGLDVPHLRKVVRQIDERLAEQERNLSLAFIQYMRFAMRTEGIGSVRRIFRLAVKKRVGTWHLYAAAADMEAHAAGDRQAAARVYAAGFKLFASERKYVRQYIQFLHQVGDHANLRVVYERVLADLPASKESVRMWNRYLEFERDTSQLGAIIKAEERRATALESVVRPSPLGDFIRRYRYADCLPCSKKLATYVRKSSRVSVATSVVGHGDQSQAARDSREAARLELQRRMRFPRPRVQDLLLFRPHMTVYDRSKHGLLPDNVAKLLFMLAPPQMYTGPALNPDILIELIASADLGPLVASVKDASEASDGAAATNDADDDEKKTIVRKKLAVGGDREEAPKSDVFRKRQRKRALAAKNTSMDDEDDDGNDDDDDGGGGGEKNKKTGAKKRKHA